MAAHHRGWLAMVGLTNHAVIPPGWEEHHRPIPVSAMTGVCDVHGPDTAGTYPDFTTTPGPVLAEGVRCRVQELKREGRAPTVAAYADTRQYQVTVPIEAWPVGVEVTDHGPRVTVTGYKPGHAGDPDLIGRRLLVINMQRGTLSWERVLTCVDDLTEGTP